MLAHIDKEISVWSSQSRVMAAQTTAVAADSLEAKLTGPNDRLDTEDEGIGNIKLVSPSFQLELLAARKLGANGRAVVGRTETPVLDTKSGMTATSK